MDGAQADVCAADPSPYTALGVVESIRAALRAREPGRTLTGSVIAVQGAGNVGSRVVELLRQEGASVLVSDVDPGRADRVAAMWGAQVAAPDDLLAATIHAPRRQLPSRAMYAAASARLRTPILR